MPDGADAVVPVERVEDHGDHVDVLQAASSRSACPATRRRRPRGRRRRGSGNATRRRADRSAGCGRRRNGRLLGSAASRDPRDGKRATEPRGEPRARSDLRVEPTDDRGCAGELRCRDRRAAGRCGRPRMRIATQSSAGSRHDVLVTSGGVSMGPHDLVRRVAAELGVDEVFWGVAIKPGKPLAFGVRGDTLVFGLPGNPVSSLVGALVFVRPALLARQGAERVRGRATCARRAHDARFAAIRIATSSCARDAPRRADGVDLEPIAGQESHMIVRAAVRRRARPRAARRGRDRGRARPCGSCLSTSGAATEPPTQAAGGGGSAPPAYGA